MFLSGTLLNSAMVLLGGSIGLLLGQRLPQAVRETVIRAIGLFTLALGAKFAIETTNVLYLLFAILVGGIVGSAARLEDRLDAFGAWLERRVARTRTNEAPSAVAEAFVTSAVLFCVGPLTFLGAIQNGLTGDATLLTIKSALDGLAALAIAAALGWGVLLSIGVILVYQGSLAAGASLLAGVLSEAHLAEMNAAGGLLILGIGLKLLDIRDVRIADYIPAIAVAPILVTIGERVQQLGPL